MSDMWGMPRESRESDLQEAVQGADKPVACAQPLGAGPGVALYVSTDAEGIGVCCFVL